MIVKLSEKIQLLLHKRYLVLEPPPYQQNKNPEHHLLLCKNRETHTLSSGCYGRGSKQRARTNTGIPLLDFSFELAQLYNVRKLTLVELGSQEQWRLLTGNVQHPKALCILLTLAQSLTENQVFFTCDFINSTKVLKIIPSLHISFSISCEQPDNPEVVLRESNLYNETFNFYCFNKYTTLTVIRNT